MSRLTLVIAGGALYTGFLRKIHRLNTIWSASGCILSWLGVYRYILDINNNGKLQQILVHLTTHEHLTYCHEHTMVQEYQNNYLKDFLLFSFCLVGLMGHLTRILFNIRIIIKNNNTVPNIRNKYHSFMLRFIMKL